MERPSRSSFQVTSVSPRRPKAAALASPGRLAVAPNRAALSIMSGTSSERVAPHAGSSATLDDLESCSCRCCAVR